MHQIACPTLKTWHQSFKQALPGEHGSRAVVLWIDKWFDLLIEYAGVGMLVEGHMERDSPKEHV